MDTESKTYSPEFLALIYLYGTVEAEGRKIIMEGLDQGLTVEQVLLAFVEAMWESGSRN